MDGIDVIYWINLPSAVERRNHLKKVLADDAFKNIPKVRIVANKPTKTLKSNFIIPISAQEGASINRIFTLKEYACLLSHLNTIREFSKSKYETALILEDDVTIELKPYWTPIQKVLDEAPKDWEIIKLNSSYYYKESDPLYTKLKFPCYFSGKNPRCKISAAAYVIKKSAAKKLMRMWNGKRYKLPDKSYFSADYLIFEKLTTYDYKYQYFMIRTNNDTQIWSKPFNNITLRKKTLELNKTRKKL
jgi:GR25 family glycosyltransferase involved in LPS biosynthesis